IGHVQQAALVHQARGVDELCILDVAATPEGRGPDFEAISRLTDKCFMPLTVGGGIRSIEDVRGLLNAGADRVCIKTAYYADFDFLDECASRFGSQAIVVALDVREEHRTTLVLDLARDIEHRGAGEILLTAMDQEGTMQGYDLELIRAVSEAVDIPVIAHGGCSGYADMLAAIGHGASAVAAGALFQFTDATPKGAAQYLSEYGVEVRL
ncbi:MAG: HisA/HisF-related TIM barrel protein, partial [Candidatus Nanopelagicales bacterium]